MKERWMYQCEWWGEDRNTNLTIYQQFAMATDRPDLAIVQILSSDFARSMKGALRNFSGPNFRVLCDDPAPLEANG